MVFSSQEFSSTVLKLCAEITRENQEKLQRRVEEIEGLKPVNVGIDAYLTLDESSNIEKVFHETQKHDDQNGDVGGSAPYKPDQTDIQSINISRRETNEWLVVERPLTLQDVRERTMGATMPYRKSIAKLNLLDENVKTPFQKLEVFG